MAMSADGMVRPVLGSSRRHPWSLNFAQKHRENNKVELPSPPGYTTSVGQIHLEEKREADPDLVAKVTTLRS